MILIGAEAGIWTSGSLTGVMQDGVGSDDLLGAEGHLQSSPRAPEWGVGHRAI